MKKSMKYSGRDAAGFFLLGLSVILLGRSLTLCFSNDIWYDELFTVGMIEHSYGELVRFTAADVHPPLYYCIVKFLVELCKLIAPGTDTIIPAKLASILPYGFLILYSATIVRRRFGMFAAGLFSFCILSMPQLSAYTVEMRMYGWAMLFVTAAFLHAWELVLCYVNQKPKPGETVQGGWEAESGSQEAERGRQRTAKGSRETESGGQETETGRAAGRRKRVRCLHGAAFVFYGLAAAYTQYFACVAVVMVYLGVLLVFWLQDRRRIREWLLCVAVSVICYVPWLFALAGQLGAVSENYWILPLTWRSLGGCVKFLMKPAFADDRVNTVLAVILFVSYLGSWCRLLAKLYHNGREIKRTLKNNEEMQRIEDTKKMEYDGTKARFAIATAGVGVLAGLVAFGFAASFLIRPIFVYRYMIPALGCFWLGFVLCLDKMLCKPGEPQSEKQAMLCKPEELQSEKQVVNIARHDPGRNRFAYYAGAALTILIIIVGLRDYRAFMGEEEYKIRLMAETEKALAQIGPQDSVVYNFDQVQAVTGWYLPETVERYLWRAEAEPLIQEITSSCGTVEETAELRERLDTAGEEGQAKGFWFIGSFSSREDIVAEWRGDGFVVEEIGSFLLERYWFNLYKIT